MVLHRECASYWGSTFSSEEKIQSQLRWRLGSQKPIHQVSPWTY
jgi:hypothetical protein